MSKSKIKISSEVVDELKRAVTKFPTWPTDPLHAIGVITEELGEVSKATLEYIYEPNKNVSLDDIKKEALQLSAMTHRFIISLDAYAYKKSDQHKQNIK